MNRSNNDAYLDASAYEAAASHGRQRAGITAGDVVRALFIACQAIGALIAVNLMLGEDAIMIVPLFYLALLPFYVLRRPNSGLHMSAPALAMIWIALGTLYAFGATTASSEVGRLSWHFVMGMSVAPTSFLLFPLLSFAKTALPMASGIKSLIAVTIFALAFYAQWFKFVPWLFAETGPQKPSNYFKQ